MLPKIISIQGATATGKSDLALKIAKSLNTYIISCDSRQIYKFMDIGTNKPSLQELKSVSHFMIDIIDPRESFNAGEFVKRVDNIILKNLPKIPVIVGGTGFYFKSLVHPLFEAPIIPQKIREYVRYLENPYKKLQEIDIESSNRLHKNNTNRITRALEIFFASGKSINTFWREQKESKKYVSYDILINQNRKILYEKIDRRFEKMIKDGLVDEIKSLLESGYSWMDPGMNTLGYKEFKPFFQGERALLECSEKGKQDVRNFAKRQITWYRKMKFDLTLSPQNNNLLAHRDLLCKIKKFAESND